MADQRLENLLALIESVELPDSAEQAAKRRYDSLGTWFDRPESALRACKPHIFPQGSFALGTAIAPLKPEDGFDLDLSCKLRQGVTRESHTQKQLKEMIQAELNAYRERYGVQEPLEPKDHCWRLHYRDELKFHEDIVPAIPADAARTSELTEGIARTGRDRPFAARLAANSTWITDRTLPSYGSISRDWPRSNQEGYREWFWSRMQPSVGSGIRLEAKVDPLPAYPRKDPLQRVIQFLKRHRDVAFQEDARSKPISIIITTIVAGGHQPGVDLAAAMDLALNTLQAFREQGVDHVWNPVDPAEEFTDKWHDGKHDHLRLREHFHGWIEQVCADFRRYMASGDFDQLFQDAEKGLQLRRPIRTLSPKHGLPVTATAAIDANDIGIPSSDAVSAVRTQGRALLRKVKAFFPWMTTPQWRFKETSTVEVRASVQGGGPLQSGQIVPKAIELDFSVHTRGGSRYLLPDGFEVFYQVVNTGSEAYRAGKDQLRGGFYRGDRHGLRNEHTSYRGIHWVKAFIVRLRDNTCVASSDRFFVVVE